MEKILNYISQTLPIEITKDNGRDALRLALQSSISAAVAFSVMNYLNLPEVFLAILSAVLVVEPSVGNTVNHAKGRILSTFVGSIIGFTFVALIPWGFGTAISLLITMFIMNAISSFNPSWRYGVVAAVAIALGSENSALETSLDRLLAIGVGIVIGMLASALIWPESASSRTNKHLRKALNEANKRFTIAYKNNKTSEKEDSSEVANKFHKHLGNAKATADAIQFGNKHKIQDQIDAIEKLYNSILIIHRVGENADDSMLDEDAGIQNDSKAINEQATDIINCFVNKKNISKNKMEDFCDLVNSAKNNVNLDESNKEKNMFRHAFVFGITETRDSIKTLSKLLKENK